MTSRKNTSPAPDDIYPGIQAERVQELNAGDVREGSYVLYWMQQSQRSELNHALEYAIHRANELEQPLLVAFGLMDDYPEANLRHYHFMLQGLQDVEQSLGRRDIAFVVQRGAPDEVAVRLAADASLVVCDRGYLRHQRAWREHVAADAGCRVIQVESDVVVPVELVSDKVETAARTIRPKITQHLDRFLVELPRAKLTTTSPQPEVDGEDVSDLDALLETLKLEHQVAPVPLFTGGTTTGKKVLAKFLAERFADYVGHRNQPQTDDVSHMSKYLHFGQLSPVYVALEVSKVEKGSGDTGDESEIAESRESYLEELIIRRELPMNYVFYEPHYDEFRGLPDWARDTLADHADDDRSPIYTRAELEAAETEDPYWNAAMREMIFSGYLHNHMRMYWGKKILEWSKTPEQAYDTVLHLNNKYFLDGRDANSFANVAWVFGRHDRGWTERDVFGKIRYMNAEGLERKAKPQAYVAKIDQLVESLESGT